VTRARGARGAARPRSSEARVLGGEGAGRSKPAKARCGKAASRAQSSEDAGLSFGVRLCGIDQARRTMIDREGATPREYTAEEH
jgi:hypothetical protein